MSKEAKDRTLANTLASIQKRFGEGAIVRLGEASHLQVEAIPSGF